MKLKKWGTIVAGAIIMFLVGNLIPVTNLYSKHIVRSHDDEETLIAVIVLVEWPLLLIFGAVCGWLFHKMYLVKPSGTPGSGGMPGLG